MEVFLTSLFFSNTFLEVISITLNAEEYKKLSVSKNKIKRKVRNQQLDFFELTNFPLISRNKKKNLSKKRKLILIRKLFNSPYIYKIPMHIHMSSFLSPSNQPSLEMQHIYNVSQEPIESNF